MGAHTLPVSELTQPRFVWWKPSMTDFFFLAIMAWSFLSSPNGWARFLLDGDVFMHTRLGQNMLETGAVATTDPASFAIPNGSPWYAFEWLAEILFATLAMHYGMGAIALLSGTLVGLSIALLYYDTLRRGGHPLLTTFLILIATNALNMNFHARPVLFTYFFVVVSMILLNRDRETPSWTIWLLPLMVIPWVNLHPGVAVLFPLIAILGIGCGTRQGFLRYATLGVACAVATLVNPYGIGLHKHLAATLSSEWILNNALEYKSPEFRGEFMLCLAILFLLGLASAGLFAVQKKYPEALWIFFLGYSTLVSRRHGAIFLLVVTPMIAIQLSGLWRQYVSGKDKKSAAGILDSLWQGAAFTPTIWLPTFALLIVIFNPMPIDENPSAEFYPSAVVARNRDLVEQSRTFTTEQWADFLYYINYPKQRVFMDPRHDLYAAPLGDAYLEILQGTPSWKKLTERYGINLMLVKPGMTLVSLLNADPEWEKIDADKVAVLYRKRQASAMIQSNEDRTLSAGNSSR